MIKKIGLIGFGHMGQAIYDQLRRKYDSRRLYVCGHHQDVAKKLKVINFFSDAGFVISKVEIVILAIKPQSFINWPDRPSLAGKLVISIMAGVAIDKLRKLTKSVKLARAMPNLGARIGQGVIGWLVTKEVEAIDKKVVREILASLGLEIEVKKENQINAITALSGSGPAYFYYFCELLTVKAMAMGFSQVQARQIIEQTFIGSAELLARAGKDSRSLRQAVSSKGGTTEAAMQVLMKSEFKNILSKTVDQAYKRAEELSK